MNNTPSHHPFTRSFSSKPISMTQRDFVRMSFLDSDSLTPLVITSAIEGVSLPDWIAGNHSFLEEKLAIHGGLLFRGFNSRTQEDFQQLLTATQVELMIYNESSTPRKKLGNNVYTSTDFPAQETIALHNELSAAATYPMKIWFFALQPSREGGETPIADVRRVYKRLSTSVQNEFMQRAWLLVRNYNDGLGLPWQEAFHTTNKEVVEDYCRKNAIDFEWKSDDRLRTRQWRQAIATHPKTGEKVWFNHIVFWHPSSLEKNLRETLLETFEKQDLPYYTCFGDGGEIEDAIIEEVRAAYQAETVVFPWETGDLLMLDNMLVAHGRKPYIGTRRILVGMGEAYTRKDVNC